MATIKIKRTTEWVYWARNFKIFIDGQFVGVIPSGATKEFQTTAGQHTVTAKIDWCSSPDFPINLNDNETKCLTVGNFKYCNWWFLFGIIMIGLFPVLARTIGFGYAILFPIPPILFFGYYSTIGRKKQLTLSETK